MKEAFSARMLRVHFGEDDRWQGKPLHEAILAKCKDLNIAEAIVFRPRPWSAVGGRPARPHPGWPDCCPPARGSRSTPNRSKRENRPVLGWG